MSGSTISAAGRGLTALSDRRRLTDALFARWLSKVSGKMPSCGDVCILPSGLRVLTIHRAERADALIGPLAALLSDAPPDPFTPEVIAVPSKGVERWVMQQLALRLGTAGVRDGVAANIAFPSPARLAGDVMSTLAGWTPDKDPWTGSRLVWAVLAVIDESVAEPWCAVLAHHLGRDDAEKSHRAWAALLLPRRRWRGCSPPTAITARRCSPTGRLRRHRRSRARAAVTTWCGRPTFWRRLRDRIGDAQPGRAAGRRVRTGCASSPTSSTCPTGCRCSGRPG